MFLGCSTFDFSDNICFFGVLLFAYVRDIAFVFEIVFFLLYPNINSSQHKLIWNKRQSQIKTKAEG